MMKRRIENIILFLIIFFQMFYYTLCDAIGTSKADTITYIKHDFSVKAWGTRTPLYPALIAVTKAVFGENRFMVIIALIQMIIFAFAVYVFYKTVELSCENKTVSLVAALFLGVNPALLDWNTVVMTESLSVSISIFFLYFVVKYIKKSGSFEGIMACVMAFTAFLIKPVLVVYLGVIIALVCLRIIMKEETKKTLIPVLTALAVCMVLVLGYASVVKANRGVFNVSALGPRHSVAKVLATESYKNYPDEKLVKQIDEVYESYNRDFGSHSCTSEVMSLINDSENQPEKNKEILEFTKACNENNPGANTAFILNCMKNDVLYNSYTLGWLYFDRANVFTNIVAKLYRLVFGQYICKMWLMFGMTVISAIFTIVKWIKEKKCPWFFLGTFGVLFIIIGINYLGSYDSFDRLTVYSLPFTIFGLAQIVKELA